jgi:hypothetical protein
MMTTSVVLALALLGVGQPEQTEPAGKEPTARESESAERLLKLARRYEFFAKQDQKTRFDLHPQPLLAYDNPIRGEVYGNIFVWTHHGRPEVVGAIFDFKSEGKFDSELHTLSRGGIQASRDGKPFWNPASPGVEFRKLPGAAAPAASAAARLRQMRELARGFTVERNHPEQGKGEMRLLTQPIYRYSSAESHVLDGAMFVFAEATDPEAYLLLEATGEERPVWQFALARMNIVEFSARYQSQEVWHVDPISWDAVFDRHEPYAIIREKPNRGLVRTQD